MARTTSQLRAAWHPHCAGDIVTLPIGNDGAKITVRRPCEEAFSALIDIVEYHRYPVRRQDTGAYNCRKITGGSGWSLHAYGIAADLNWQTNPYGSRLITDMPMAMVLDILALRTGSGHRVFRWGGDWDYIPSTPHAKYDAMHFEIVASPAELATGITGRTDNPEGDTVKHGESGPHVAAFQQLVNLFLLATGSPEDDPILLGTDGTFGDRTANAMVHVHGRLQRHAFHQLGDRPLLTDPDPRDVPVDVRVLMGAVIAERELPKVAS